MESFPDSLASQVRKGFGEHCKRRKDFRKANEYFKQSLQNDPEKMDAVYRLTNSHCQVAELDAALKIFAEKSRYGSNFPMKIFSI